MKNKLKVKTKGTLKNEEVTLRVLLIICIVLFFLSAILEVYKFKITCNIDYIINLMLGISCSSIISYMSLFFPYINKKNEQINSVISNLKYIYIKYQYIYLMISYKTQRDDLLFEKNLLSDVEILIDKIQTSILQYARFDFTSESIENINKVLNEKITNNLLAIKEFCSCLIKFENVPNNDEVVFFLKKDIITKRADKDLYKFLLETIESLYSIEKINEVYAPILDSNTTVLKSALNKMADDISEIHELEKLKIKLAIGIKISTKILEIINKHNNDYDKEYVSFMSRLSKVTELIEKTNHTKETNDKYIIAIKEIHNAIRNDDFKKAEQLIKEIENTLSAEVE